MSEESRKNEELQIMKEQLASLAKKATKKTWFKSAVAVLIALVVGFGGASALFLTKPWEKNEETTPVSTVSEEEQDKTVEIATLTIDEVESVISAASDLVSTKYFFTDADTYEKHKEWLNGKKVPFTTDKVIFKYNGTVYLGIDLSKVVCEVDNNDKTIYVTLPEVTVLSCDIDKTSFEYLHKEDSAFTKTDMEDYTDMLAELENTKKEVILANATLMLETRKNTERVIKEFLALAETTGKYEVIFK